MFYPIKRAFLTVFLTLTVSLQCQAIDSKTIDTIDKIVSLAAGTISCAGTVALPIVYAWNRFGMHSSTKVAMGTGIAATAMGCVIFSYIAADSWGLLEKRERYTKIQESDAYQVIREDYGDQKAHIVAWIFSSVEDVSGFSDAFDNALEILADPNLDKPGSFATTTKTSVDQHI